MGSGTASKLKPQPKQLRLQDDYCYIPMFVSFFASSHVFGRPCFVVATVPNHKYIQPHNWGSKRTHNSVFFCCQAALSRSPPQSLHGKVPAKQPQISSTTEDTLLHWHLTRPWLPSSYHPVSQRKTHGFHSHVNQIGFMCWFAGKVITTNPWPLKKT